MNTPLRPNSNIISTPPPKQQKNTPLPRSNSNRPFPGPLKQQQDEPATPCFLFFSVWASACCFLAVWAVPPKQQKQPRPKRHKKKKSSYRRQTISLRNHFVRETATRSHCFDIWGATLRAAPRIDINAFMQRLCGGYALMHVYARSCSQLGAPLDK